MAWKQYKTTLHTWQHVKLKVKDSSRIAQTDNTNVKIFNECRIYRLEDIKKICLNNVKGFQV